MDYAAYQGFKDPEADMSVLLDSRGARKTETLFVESISNRAKDSGYEPLYALREHCKGEKPSAYQIYMASVDETDAALKLVGSMAHWRRLCGLKWFMEGSEVMGHEGLIQWRKDMQARDASRAKRQLMESAAAGNVSAQRELYNQATKKAPGRPAKAKDDPKAKTIAAIHNEVFNKK